MNDLAARALRWAAGSFVVWLSADVLGDPRVALIAGWAARLFFLAFVALMIILGLSGRPRPRD